MNKFIPLVVLAAVAAACASKGGGSYDSFFGAPVKNKVNIKVDSITFEKISLPVINTSYSGFSALLSGEILPQSKLLESLRLRNTCRSCRLII